MRKKVVLELAKREIEYLSTRKVVYGYSYYISLSECDIEAVTDENSEQIESMIRECAEQEFGCRVKLVYNQEYNEVFIFPDCTNDLVGDYIRQSFRRAGKESGEAYALYKFDTKESLLEYDMSEISEDVLCAFGEEFTYDDFLSLGAIELWECSFKTMIKSVDGLVDDSDEEPNQIASFRCSDLWNLNPYMSYNNGNMIFYDGGQRYNVCVHCGRKMKESMLFMGCWCICRCCSNAILAMYDSNKCDACPAKRRLVYKRFEEWKKENGYEDRAIKELADFQKEYILSQMDLSETYDVKGHGLVERISLPEDMFEIIDEELEMAIRSFMQNLETINGEKVLVWFVASVDRMLLYERYIGQRAHAEY